MEKPVIAITMGDAAGIGPELIIKVLSQRTAWDICHPFVVGDPKIMVDICRMVGTNLQFKAIGNLSEVNFSPSVVEVLCPEGLRVDHVRWGQVDPAMGRAAALCLQKAFEMALVGEIHGVVSAPLNKEAFHLAGYQYMDELAYLAHLTRSSEPFTVGVMDRVWTVAVTEHVPFRDIVDLIKKDRILKQISHLHGILKKAGFTDPKIAMAALNVHAGEGGLFGREEIDEIGPAIQRAKQQGINVQGPFPADTVFVTAMDEGFDGVVCMYHDQANIARKLLAKRTGATLFMGLPVICGTTAHGTAFDKAGKGISDPGSLEAALKYTVKLSS
ncbi:MAG: PdxA family protein [Candidatus Bipolaricaulia bacterium]